MPRRVSRMRAAIVGGTATGFALLVVRNAGLWRVNDGRNQPGGYASEGERTRWERQNFRGNDVDLRGGPALTLGLLSAAEASGDGRFAAAHTIAVAAAAASGLTDDIAERDNTVKGLRGHLGALAHGHVTTGFLKIVGIGAGALGAAIALDAVGTSKMEHQRPPNVRRVATVFVRAGLIAGTSNLLNLFDLRPGRALKIGVASSVALSALSREKAPSAVGTFAACAAALPADLGEKTMLGDCGANALGASLGVNLASRLKLKGAAIALAGVSGLILASEKVSFTKIIERTPALRRIDQWGRKP